MQGRHEIACISWTHLYGHPKKARLALCIRTLWGRSLHHLSFVAVVHHSFRDIIYVLHNIRSIYMQNH